MKIIRAINRKPSMSAGRHGPLGRLGEFLDHPSALEPGEMIDEEDAVQMVDLVLQASGE
jgi:hypothetical protein